MLTSWNCNGTALVTATADADAAATIAEGFMMDGLLVNLSLAFFVVPAESNFDHRLVNE